MIRLKHKIYPVWFQWEGDEDNFNNAKSAVLEDINLNGFKHFTVYEDITDEVSDQQDYWDKDSVVATDENSEVKAKEEPVKKEKTSKSNVVSKKPSSKTSKQQRKINERISKVTTYDIETRQPTEPVSELTTDTTK